MMLKKKVKELEALNKTARKLASTLQEDEVVHVGLVQIEEFLASDLVMIFMKDGDRLVPKALRTTNDHFQKEQIPIHYVGECLCGLAVGDNKPIYSVDIYDDPRCTLEECKKAGFRSFAAIPLITEENLIGALAIASREKRDFSELATFFETFVDQLATSIQKTRFYAQVRSKAEELQQGYLDLTLARDKIKKSKDLLQSIFDGISEPLILIDKGFIIKALNRAGIEYYGSSLKSVIGKQSWKGLLKDRKEICEQCDIRHEMRDQKEVTYDRKSPIHPGRLERVHQYPVGHGDVDGRYIMRITDITEEKRIEKELAQADKMISLGVLVAGMAHEINNPNNLVMLNTPSLRESWEDFEPIIDRYYEKNGDFLVSGLPYSTMKKEIPELFRAIEKGALRIKRIVTDLKDFSRHNASGVDQTVQIEAIIKSATGLIHNLIRKSTHTFICECDRNLPTLKGNKQKLEQVIINLLQNACQSLPNRDCSIFLKCCLSSEKEHIVIEVQDEGIGIPEEIIPYIMDPFFTTKREFGGTGLGLSVTSNIVKEHGGKIEVESRPREGSVFKILLPLERKLIPPRILLADDDDSVRKLYVEFLENTNSYRVSGAKGGVEALLKLGTDRPDLLILDIEMPDMDGLEICRQMKQNPQFSTIKIIIITAFKESPKIKEIKEMGFGTILYKPVDLEDLAGAVKSALEIK